MKSDCFSHTCDAAKLKFVKTGGMFTLCISNTDNVRRDKCGFMHPFKAQRCVVYSVKTKHTHI